MGPDEDDEIDVGSVVIDEFGDAGVVTCISDREARVLYPGLTLEVPVPLDVLDLAADQNLFAGEGGQ